MKAWAGKIAKESEMYNCYAVCSISAEEAPLLSFGASLSKELAPRENSLPSTAAVRRNRAQRAVFSV